MADSTRMQPTDLLEINLLNSKISHILRQLLCFRKGYTGPISTNNMDVRSLYLLITAKRRCHTILLVQAFIHV